MKWMQKMEKYFGVYKKGKICYIILSVDFSRSGIWGKLGIGVQGICLKSCAKFPPNRTMFP